LARSRISSNVPDAVDVIMVLLAFESINDCRLAIRIGRAAVGAASTLAFVGEAWPRYPESGEVQPLASVSWTVGSGDRRSMDALILQLMYKLDAVLAAGEFRRVMTDS
jgi:hypothetical protein